MKSTNKLPKGELPFYNQVKGAIGVRQGLPGMSSASVVPRKKGYSFSLFFMRYKVSLRHPPAAPFISLAFTLYVFPHLLIVEEIVEGIIIFVSISPISESGIFIISIAGVTVISVALAAVLVLGIIIL